MFEKTWLVVRAVGQISSFLGYLISRSARLRIRRIHYYLSSSASSKNAHHEPRNIVVVGASMAGYHAAKSIAESLLPGSPYQVVVIEAHDHFHFTWVLPRFCVVEGHEHKAFIPYGPHLRHIPESTLRWVQGRAVRITKDNVYLSSGNEVSYDFLVVATVAGATDALPSRVDSDDKVEGITRLQDIQTKIKEANNLVVVGGVHSRDNVMHRFGPRLQKAAMEGLEGLRIQVITSDRLIREDKKRGVVVLKSGKEVECDFLVSCVGQRPNSSLIAELSPGSVTSSGHIRVKPTMQIDDESLPNVYVCGDVAETNTPNPNSRTGAQASVVADNVILAIDGHKPTNKYKLQWLEGLIKLTLGLDKSVTYVDDFSGSELLFSAKEKDLDLMSGGVWKHMGATPFQDDTTMLQKFLAKE
ncbi:FAD/NAD(P)-binding domain-containing protein [Xylaria sp. FL0064]|nr:FAD/NAD(P)-binding domain-containing protein [Xylaria sp. FL0064]